MNTLRTPARGTRHQLGKPAFGLLAFPALLFLSACAGTATLPAPVVDLSQAPAPGVAMKSVPNSTPGISADETRPGEGVIVSALTEPSAQPGAAAVGPGAGQSIAPTPLTGVAAQGTNPAVLSLLNRADRDQRSGDFSRAAVSIERALKIEPDNAWLWHRLALARFEQGRMGQTAALAAKSNTLAGADPGKRDLMAKNWLLIARVHARRGENIAAQAATDQARRIQSGSS